MSANNKSHSARNTLIAFLAFGVVVFLAIKFVDFTAVVDTFLGMDFEASPELSDIIEKDNFTKKATRILKASKPELLNAGDFNSKCYSDLEKENSVLGCYTNNTIFVYDIDNAELNGIKETVLAHELLHAIWSRMSINERRDLYDDLEIIYRQEEKELSDHMSGYSEDEYYDELHSVIGTQVADEKLTAALRDHYAEYFESQAKIVGFYDAYNGKFKALENRARELEAEIEQRRTQIDNLTASYEAESRDLLANIESFNARAESGGFSDMASFYSERNALVSRQSQLNSNYEALNALIDETNALITEYNSNVVEVGKLYDSVNSRVQKPSAELND